jgi:hypothetical protein
MNLLQAIKAVQTQAANNSIHDLVIPRNPKTGGPSGSRGLAAGLHEMNLEHEDDSEEDEEAYDDD